MVFFHLYESYEEGQSSKTLTLTLVKFRVYIPCVFAHLANGHLPTFLGMCPLGTWAFAHLGLARGYLPTYAN